MDIEISIVCNSCDLYRKKAKKIVTNSQKRPVMGRLRFKHKIIFCNFKNFLSFDAFVYQTR